MWALGSFGQYNANVWGSKKQDAKYQTNFDKIIADDKSDSNRVFRLECDGCATTHRSIYYGRLEKSNKIPAGFSFYKTMIMQWTKKDNELAKDMLIAS